MGLWQLVLAVGSLATAGVYLCWQQIEDKLAPLAAKALSRKLGVRVSIGSVSIRKTRFGATNITIANGPAPEGGDGWKCPHFAHVEEMTLTTPGWLGTFSLPGALRTGNFVLGFERRDISTMAVRGVRIFVEEQKVDGKRIANNDFLKVLEAEEKAKKAKAAEAEVVRIKAWRKQWEAEQDLPVGDEDFESESVASEEAEQGQGEMDLSIKGRYAMAMDVLRNTQGQSLTERASALAEHRKNVVAQLKEKKEIKHQIRQGKRAKDDELIQVGRIVIEDCEVKMLGHKMLLEEAFVVRAYSGTVGGLKQTVAKGFFSKALANTVEHHTEKIAERAAVMKDSSRESVRTEKILQKASQINQAGKDKVGEVKQMVKDKAAAARNLLGRFAT